MLGEILDEGLTLLLGDTLGLCEDEGEILELGLMDGETELDPVDGDGLSLLDGDTDGETLLDGLIEEEGLTLGLTELDGDIDAEGLTDGD